MVEAARFHIRIAAALLLWLAPPAEAQQPQQAAFGSGIGVVDTVVQGDFTPTAAFILQEVGPGKVRQYRAVIETIIERNKTAPDRPISVVGAPVPLNAAQDRFHFTFFLADDTTMFRATPVRRWAVEELRMNSLSITALERDMLDLEAEIKDKRVEAVELQDQTAELLNKASESAGIAELLALEREKRSLSRSLEDRRTEIARLESLIERGRELEDPPEVDEMRRELSIHLREAAQATAMADRLNRRQREAAVQTFNQKLSMVREMEREDPEALARRVLELRRKRREFEGRLGVSAEERQLADF